MKQLIIILGLIAVMITVPQALLLWSLGNGPTCGDSDGRVAQARYPRCEHPVPINLWTGKPEE